MIYSYWGPSGTLLKEQGSSKLVLGSFFLDQEDIRELGMGAIWNFVKGTGLLQPSTEYGAQRACHKA